MKLDGTVTLSMIVALCALISPIFVSVVNNRHTYKTHKLDLEFSEMKEEKQIIRTVFENYLQYLYQCLSDPDPYSEFVYRYAESYGKAIVYMKNDELSDAQNIYRDIINRKSPPDLNDVDYHADKIRARLAQPQAKSK